VSNAQLGAVALGAGAALVASPYLAQLTLTVPDRANSRWWRGGSTTRSRWIATAATSVALGMLSGRVAGWSWLLPAWLVLAAACAPLVLIDVEHHRLPDRLVFAAAAGCSALLALAGALDDDWDRLLRCVEGGAVVFAVFFVMAMSAPFGFGDVKLGAVLAACLAWLGWGYVLYGILGGFVLATIVSAPLLILRRASMKSFIPFGPAMIFAAFLVAAFDLAPSSLR